MQSRVKILALGLVLSACGSVEQRQIANGDFEYLKEQQSPGLAIPSDVDQPYFKDSFDIPAVGEEAPDYLLGDKVTVLSPALVLPLVTGSHVEEGSREATVFFDQVDDSQPLDATIWNSLINFLEEQGIAVDSFDKAQQRLVTDWMIIEKEEDTAWYSWTSTQRSIGRRFEFNLAVKPHGRTAALQATLTDYLETLNDEVVADIETASTRRNEVDVLNQVIGHYANQIRVAEVKRIRKIREGLAMELGFDKEGEPAFVVDAGYDVAWPRLLLVLRKLGFNVKDLDQSTGLLFVKYGGEESSWWDNLFGGDQGLPLEEDEYRLQVREMGAKTSVTLLDDESNPFTIDRVTNLYEPFAETMAANDLDI